MLPPKENILKSELIVPKGNWSSLCLCTICAKLAINLLELHHLREHGAVVGHIGQVLL
jgi:hypothetical protein